jgi:hypothetical protein
MTTEQIAALRKMLRDDSPLTLDQARQAALDALPALLAAAEREAKMRAALRECEIFMATLKLDALMPDNPLAAIGQAALQQARAALAEGGGK